MLGTLAASLSVSALKVFRWMSDKTRSRFLMLSPSLTNFEVQKYYQNKPKLNDVCAKNNLPKTKNGAYTINLH